jgi:competence protein ComEC
MALVIGTVLVPGILLGIPRRPRILGGVVVGALYVILVGPEPSVLRAATMLAPLMAARFAGTRASPLACLALAIAVWSATDPPTAASVGFVLSALATGAILVLAPILAHVLVDLTGERVPEAAALVLAVPLAAQLLCTPVLVLLTPEVSVWAVMANVVVAPLVGPVLPGAAALCWQLSAGGAGIVVRVARTADALPGSRVPVPEGAGGVLVALGLLALVLLAAIGRRSPMIRFLVALVLVLALVPPVASRLPLPGTEVNWRVAACAVGQGDAVLLRAGETVVLVDTGPEPDLLEECLDRLRIRSIDLLVLTHPHADHVGGREALIGAREPATQWICPDPEASGKVVDRPGTAAEVDAPLRGATWQAGGLALEVLWPASASDALDAARREDRGGEGDGLNDCSVVVVATWSDGMRYVGLGDLEPAAQAQLTKQGVPSADVVKIAHHGSRRQHEELYRTLDARVLVVTVGADNGYGHPSSDALDLRHLSGAALLRTDQDGTVILGSDEAGELWARSVGPAR